MTTPRTMLLAAAAASFMFACGKSEPQPPAQSADTSQKPADKPKLEAQDLEHSQLEVQTPFVLTVLTDPATLPDSGLVKVTATITSGNGFKAPVELKVALPSGAKLVSGKETESLGQLEPGKLARIYEVQLASRPTEADPIRVIADAKDPQGRFGAHAERKIPEHVTQYVSPYAGNVPPPPVSRPGQGMPVHPTGKVAKPHE